MAMRNALFAALALLFATPACAAPPAPQTIHPALFVARDADSTLYLFGTVHVRPRGAPWGGPEAEAALAAAEDVWTEMEISPATDARGEQLVRELGMAPPGHPLSSQLTAAENARLAAAEQALGVPPAALEPMQPWLAAITLTYVPVLRAGYDPNSGADRAIDAFGDANHKNMRAFETIDDQLGFLANLSPGLQRQMLLDTIDEAEKGPAELTELVEAWERGDTDALQRIVVDETREAFPELYDVLFRRRNAVWMGVIMHEMEGSGVGFVAVGAGHLLGPDGLVAQLRARGVRVERVPAR